LRSAAWRSFAENSFAETGLPWFIGQAVADDSWVLPGEEV
jgi:hypothetical protein